MRSGSYQIPAATLLLWVVVSGCGEIDHTIGRRVQDSSTPLKKETSTTKIGDGGNSTKDATAGSRDSAPNDSRVDQGVGVTEGGTEETGVGPALGDAGCIPEPPYKPTLEIYMMVDAFLRFDLDALVQQMPQIPGTGTWQGPSTWDSSISTSASDEFITFLSTPINQEIGVGTKFYGFRCDAEPYKRPDVDIYRLDSTNPSTGKKQIDSINKSFQEPMSPPNYLLEANALTGAIAYARERAKKQGSLSTPPNTKVVVFFLVTAIPYFAQYYSLCLPSQTTTEEVAKSGFQVQDSPSIETYVIGVDPIGFNTPDFQALVNELRTVAQSGGTKDAYIANIYPTGVNLGKILQKARLDTACTFPYPLRSNGVAVNPASVKVYYGPEGQRQLLNYWENINSCSSDSGGWYYDNITTPKWIITCPKTCDGITSSSWSSPEESIRIEVSCL